MGSNLFLRIARGSSILYPLCVKFSGMILIFAIAKIITASNGLALYGEYSQVVSFSMLSLSVVGGGFAQSFIRKTTLLSTDQKIEVLQNESKIIFCNAALFCLCCIPLLAIFMVWDVSVSLVVAVFVILNCTYRLRFSYLRTTSLAHWSETPDMLARQLFFILLITIFQPDHLATLFFCAAISFFGAILVQKTLTKDLLLMPSFTFPSYSKYKLFFRREELGVWVYNLLVLFREFLEISLVILILDAAIGGQYKLLSQFALGFLAIFNSLNLVNSAKLSNFIAKNAMAELNEFLRTELIQGLLYYTSIFIGFILAVNFFEVFAIFSLPDNSTRVFFFVLASSLLNLLVGPMSQLAIHAGELRVLNTLSLVRVLMIGLGASAFLWSEQRLTLIEVVVLYLVCEMIFLAGLSYNMKTKVGVDPAIVSLAKGLR